MYNENIIICGCVKNCAKYLNKILDNMETIGKLFKNYKIIIAFDKSSDKSFEILNSRKKNNNKIIVLENSNKLSKFRTQNICNARNLILDKIRNNFKSWKYFIMMDCDNVCEKKININTFNEVMSTTNVWDCVSFITEPYNDCWALSFDPYIYSCWHWGDSPDECRWYNNNVLRKHLLSEIKKSKNNYISCLSSFNGFAVYKTNKFINCNYEWNFNKVLSYLPKDILDKSYKLLKKIPDRKWNHMGLKREEDCEHRYFHIDGIKKNNTKNMIYIKKLFD